MKIYLVAREFIFNILYIRYVTSKKGQSAMFLFTSFFIQKKTRYTVTARYKQASDRFQFSVLGIGIRRFSVRYFFNFYRELIKHNISNIIDSEGQSFFSYNVSLHADRSALHNSQPESFHKVTRTSTVGESPDLSLKSYTDKVGSR